MICLDRKKLGIEIARHWESSSQIATEFCQSNGNLQGRLFIVTLRRSLVWIATQKNAASNSTQIFSESSPNRDITTPNGRFLARYWSRRFYGNRDGNAALFG
jgi:hypothetical protein